MPASSLFQNGDTVVLRSNRAQVGRIIRDPDLDGGEYWYRVQFAAQVKNVVEDDLELLTGDLDSVESLISQGRWGHVDSFRCALAVERITQTDSRSTVYSYRAQRILFEAYQYKPLLKILDSPDRRLLIADEVGLGKTIEAGLILTEFEARHRSLDRVLIVCPSRLRQKWREELNRKFDQDFEIFDKRALLQYVERLRDNPHRSRLRAIVSMQTLRNEQLREQLLAEVPQIDVVIVDEAHHARNPLTQTSETLRDIAAIGVCVVLLTATPLHLGSKDLFTLLNALRPTEFRDANVFENDLRRHRGVIEAGLRVRTRAAEALPQVVDLLREVFVDGSLFDVQDPLAKQVIEEIQQAPPEDARDWVDLERRIQDLHPLASILTRTRKRDVQENAPMRRAHVVSCPWTEEEDDAYRRLVRSAAKRGWIQGRLGFGEIQRARQAASCLPATYNTHMALPATSDDEAVELSDIMPSETLEAPADEDAHAIGRTSGPWSGPDSKYAKLREILDLLSAEEPQAKVLVFSYFRGTVNYLADRLSAEGFPALSIHGDVRSSPTRPEHDERGRRILQFREDPSVRALISTEVGSEGLDFQFCHHVVNYDLPWNPMVVEQRIGRIDRFGQESNVVHIHNLVVEGTVEDRILLRLYKRIGIFEQSIGDLEAILGETVSELQRDYVSGKLTPEEADLRVDQAAWAINRRRSHLETLERNAADLFGHDEYIRQEMERVGRLGRFVSENAMLAVLRSYLQICHPTIQLWEEVTGIFGLRLTDELRRDIQDASRGGHVWMDRSRSGRLLVTTHGDIAFRRSDVELINVSHPLVRAAVAAIGQQLKDAAARVGQAVVRLERNADLELSSGKFFVAVFTHQVDGLRARQILETAAWSETDGRLLGAEESERLLHLVVERGQQWDSSQDAHAMPTALWNQIVSQVRTRNRHLLEREKRENEALYVRRRRAIEAEYQYDRQLKATRLETARARGREDRILRAFQGQVDKADSNHRERLASLDQTREVSAQLSDPVAACLVEVRRI